MIRRIVQIIALFLTNLHWQGFFKRTIYQGPWKQLCHPGLQCYSCPSAVTACPLGAFQNALAGLRAAFTDGVAHYGLYVGGFLGVAGMIGGRLVCGWICPFGLLQDLLSRIPTVKLRLPRLLSYGKYVILALFVVGLPLLLSFYEVRFEGLLPIITENPGGQTYPWFCKAICPAGTLTAGVPLLFLDPGLREAVGFWFRLKWVILILFLGWMVVTPRAFCRVACPLGALYGLFNKISLYRLSVQTEKCTRCNRCQTVCPVDLKTYENPNHPECIRCLECTRSCPTRALKGSFETVRIYTQPAPVVKDDQKPDLSESR